MQEINIVILWRLNIPSPSLQQDNWYGSLGSGLWSPPGFVRHPDIRQLIYQQTTNLEQCSTLPWSWHDVQQNRLVHRWAEVPADHFLSPSLHWQSVEHITMITPCTSETVINYTWQHIKSAVFKYLLIWLWESITKYFWKQ